MKQAEIYDPDKQQIEGAIHEAFQYFHSTKLKPMHSTRSFSQRRSEIEKQLELGYSFKTGRSSSRQGRRRTRTIGFLKDDDSKQEPGSQAKSAGNRSRGSMGSERRCQQNYHDSELTESQGALHQDCQHDYERRKE